MTSLLLMLRRGLDVFFQHWGRLVLVMVLVPCLLGAGGFIVGSSSTVTARLWTDRSPLVAAVLQLDPNSTAGPGLTEGVLLRELVASDSYLNRVLDGAQAGFKTMTATAQESIRRAVRARLTVSNDGSHLITITYIDRDAAFGKRLIETIVARFDEYLAGLQAGRGSGGQVSPQQLQTAKSAVDSASRALELYRASRSNDPAVLAQDPAYQTLTAQAKAKSDVYVQLLAAAQSSEVLAASSLSGDSALFRIADAPNATPTPINSSHPAVRLFLAGLAMAAGAIASIVYVMGVRDPRVLSGDDIPRVGLEFLGTSRPL